MAKLRRYFFVVPLLAFLAGSGVGTPEVVEANTVQNSDYGDYGYCPPLCPDGYYCFLYGYCDLDCCYCDSCAPLP
jgi:hypothetical protein